MVFLLDKPATNEHNLLTYQGGIYIYLPFKRNLAGLTLWSASCPPCLKELSELQKIYQKYKKSEDVQVITIAMYYDPPNRIKDAQSQPVLQQYIKER